jgi:dipeptide transport system ATP-binding protein
VLAGELPSPLNPPSGCAFHKRCPHAIERCRVEVPVLAEVATMQWAACHRSAELA